jgi:hypothetical protein
MQTEQVMDSRARRAAAAHDCYLIRSRRYAPPNDFGDYLVLDAITNLPVAGYQYDMTAEEVIEYFAGV